MTVQTGRIRKRDACVWSPTKREKLPENIIRQVIEAIKNEEVLPGDRMPGEVELAANFGVSRNSIREAMNVLTWFGLLEKRQGQGTQISPQARQKVNNLELVRRLSEDSSLVELTEMRMTLDSQIAYWVAERATPDEIDELERVLQEDERSIAECRADDAVSMEEPSRFHRALSHMCGNKLARKLFESLSAEIVESRKSYFMHANEMEEMEKRRRWNLEDHKKILAHIKSRDPAGAQRLMYEHLLTMLVQMAEDR